MPIWKNGGKVESALSTVADAFSGTSLAVRCYESHPVLTVGTGKLYGGAARHPKMKTADVYVVLQDGDLTGRQSDPWETQAVIEVQYKIRDMGVPENVPRFKKLVTWLCHQLQAGKHVHVGCIGGHGRTGLVLSAILAECANEKDAIQYVRKHYCKRAVESKAQVAFLMKHYGVSKAEPTKSYDRKDEGGGSQVSSVSSWASPAWLAGASERPAKALSKAPAPLLGKVRRVIPQGLTKATKSFGPMASARSLWKPTKRKG